jgi:tetratricopeptide (TPR) repeat protein
MGQLLYYALFFVVGSGLIYAHPWVAGFAIFIFLFRNRLPDPLVFFRTRGRIRSLQIQINQNAENVTARRDLALVWLERKRPRRALTLLEEALRREHESAEIEYLYGLALSRTGRDEEALPHFVAAQALEPKLRYGDIYLAAAVALLQLGRGAEAEDSLLRFLKINASSVEGWVRLAKLRRKQGDKDGARDALSAAAEAFDQSPRFRRRKEFGWYLRAQLARVI